ncbi:MAG: protein kinase domain-containing protein, partial [Bradymonadaceae bacterium]
MASIILGPFVLEKPIGQGGMGAVWKGRHIAQNEPVAVKIMHRDVLRNPEYVEAFRSEVRHVAALDHPGIVVVFDYGEISEEAEQDSGGQLVKGSPYIVMEYASKGSLQEIQAYLGWAELRQVLLVVLDALAHAHARNVIHRDLKPENILVGCSGTQAIKLTDFGLAHATDRFRDSSRVEDVWGTPQYMAPEQLRGLWRDYGPWTDLYGLGCMAYQLVCGKYLYDGASVWEIGKAHMMSPIPALEPKIAVPDGFEEWLVRLLQKERFHRFQTAADAAWVLRQLDGGLSGGKARPLADLMSSNEEKGDEPITVLLSRIAGAPTIQTRTRTVDLDDWFAANPMDEISSDYEGAAGDLPGMPPIREDWRPTRDGHRSPHLLGVGLGLYGLRSIPLVDRDKERDLIWSSLRSVHEETSARAIVFRGVGGTGKSELVQWMSRRAVELGSATVLKATHDPGPSSAPGPSDGLEAMMGRHLRCLKLERDEIEARLRDKFKKWGVRDDYAVLAMTEFLSPLRQDLLDDDVNEAARSVRFFSSRQRYALLYEHLERLAVERPVIVWLDDVQTGADALGFVHYVLEAQSVRPASVLLLMTVNDETLDSRDVERLLLNEVLEQPGVMVCPIGPLEDEDTSTLVQHLLGLDDALARQVKKRSQGIPLFAVQLVGDWVGQGKLTLGPEGFSIRPGEVIEIPDDLHALWGERLDKVLAGHDEGARVSLEIAAALGQTVDSREWRSACRFGKAQATTRLVEELIKEGLAESAESGWSFSHGMLRESIERTAREQGRWARGSAACAHMLFHLYSPKDFGVSERFGRHMIEAGWPGEALAPFLTAVDLLIERSEFRRAHVLLDEREDILSRLNAPDNEPERCQGWTRRAAILEYEGRYTEALTQASEAAH